MCVRTLHYQYNIHFAFVGDYPPKGQDRVYRAFPVLLPIETLNVTAHNVDIMRPYQPQLSCEGPIGVHYSWFNGLARYVFKMLATVETNLVWGGDYKALVVPIMKKALGIDQFHRELNTTGHGFHPQWAGRLIRHNLKIAYTPWVIRQNPERFASFYGIFPSCGIPRDMKKVFLSLQKLD